jgi:hypothetical protein
MRTRYHRGYLRLGHRKTRPACWEFLWWDNVPEGRRVRRKSIIGTVLQYPNVEDAWQASNGLRVSINEARNRQPEQVITVADLIDHYTKTELAIDLGDEGKSPATRIIYKAFLGRWVRPAWGSLNIRGVRTTAVEHWLRQLVRADGNPMAPSTKGKIRNLMSTLCSTTPSVINGWSKAEIPFYSCGKVPSGKESQSVWSPRNCEPYFRNLIAAFV